MQNGLKRLHGGDEYEYEAMYEAIFEVVSFQEYEMALFTIHNFYHLNKFQARQHPTCMGLLRKV